MDPAHPESLRLDIGRMNEDGSGMSDKLAAAVASLGWVPLDDCIAEGPHAQAKRIKLPAAAGKWPWVASTMRLAQNIEACHTLTAETATSLRVVWSSWATVVQPPQRSKRFPRMTPKALQRRLYRLDHLLDFSLPTMLPEIEAASSNALALTDGGMNPSQTGVQIRPSPGGQAARLRGGPPLEGRALLSQTGLW